MVVRLTWPAVAALRGGAGSPKGLLSRVWVPHGPGVTADTVCLWRGMGVGSGPAWETDWRWNRGCCAGGLLAVRVEVEEGSVGDVAVVT